MDQAILDSDVIEADENRKSSLVEGADRTIYSLVFHLEIVQCHVDIRVIGALQPDRCISGYIRESSLVDNVLEIEQWLGPSRIRIPGFIHTVVIPERVTGTAIRNYPGETPRPGHATFKNELVAGRVSIGVSESLHAWAALPRGGL